MIVYSDDSCENMLYAYTKKQIKQTGYFCTYPSAAAMLGTMYFKKNLTPQSINLQARLHVEVFAAATPRLLNWCY